MLSRKEIEDGLAQFTGTGSYWIHQPGLVLTDGAQWLAENAECFWLYDIIWSVKPRLTGDWLAVLTLMVFPAQNAKVTIEDGNGNVLYRQSIPFTDFPTPVRNVSPFDLSPSKLLLHKREVHKMRCPKCGVAGTKVTHSYRGPNDTRLRRRHCKTCDTRFITVVEEAPVDEAALRLSPSERRELTELLTQLLRLLRYWYH